MEVVPARAVWYGHDICAVDRIYRELEVPIIFKGPLEKRKDVLKTLVEVFFPETDQNSDIFLEKMETLRFLPFIRMMSKGNNDSLAAWHKTFYIPKTRSFYERKKKNLGRPSHSIWTGER